MKRPGSNVRLRKDAFEKAFAKYAPEVTTIAGRADLIGIDRSHYYRIVVNQALNPGGVFIGSTLAYFKQHGVDFEDLFYDARIGSR